MNEPAELEETDSKADVLALSENFRGGTAAHKQAAFDAGCP